MRMKIDARKLDSATQAHLRRLVVLAVRSGMKQGEAGHKYQVSLRAVNQWVARSKAGGLRALKPKRRGRPRGRGRLNAKQAAHIRRLVIGKMPDQLKLPFYLWTRAAVVQLIAQTYRLRLSLTSVGRYLKAWGLSAQKPVRRVYERNEEAIEGFSSALGYIKRTLASQLGLRYMPNLKFFYDESFDYGERIESVLKDIEVDDE